MSFQSRSLNWQALDATPIQEAKSRLDNIVWPATGFKPNPLNGSNVEAWLSGDIQVTVIHPWNMGQWAGKDRNCDYWLSSKDALTYLTKQLESAEFEQAIVILVTGESIKPFCSNLSEVCKAFPTAELLFCLRHAEHLAVIEQEQLHIQRSERDLKRRSASDRVTALNPFYAAHHQIKATSDAYSSDQAPEQIAAAFKAKRLSKYQDRLEAINKLKAQSGNIQQIALCHSHSDIEKLAAPNPSHPLCAVLSYSGSADSLETMKEVLGL